MIVGALMVVFMRNPVSSALSMVLSFIGLAGLFIGINAYFVGILQVLVYAGAIMVLFIFIIMLLDLQKEESHPRRAASIARAGPSTEGMVRWCASAVMPKPTTSA